MVNSKLNDGKVLVVITTHNRAYYLEKAIQSALNQSYKNIEILIADNSINEDSREMIEKNFKDKVLYHRSGYGLSASDHGIHIEKFVQKEFNHEFLTFFHDDDLMFDNHIAIAVKILNENSIAAVSTSAITIDTNGAIIGKKSYFKIFLDRKIFGYWGVLTACWLNPIICPSIVYRKDLKNLSVEDFFKTSLNYHDYSSNILTIYMHGVIISSKETIYYREHDGQDSISFGDMHFGLHVNARNAALQKINLNIVAEKFALFIFSILDFIYIKYKKIKSR